jgi:hypothetical protein
LIPPDLHGVRVVAGELHDHPTWFRDPDVELDIASGLIVENVPGS